MLMINLVFIHRKSANYSVNVYSNRNITPPLCPCVQVSGCSDEWSRLQSVVSMLRVVIDLPATADWVNDVMLYRRNVADVLRGFITDCQLTAVNSSHKLSAAVMTDAEKILTLLTL